MNTSQSQPGIKQSGKSQLTRHSDTGRTTYRWRVWSEQERQGMNPCFATDHRFTCNKTHCRWWNECQDLRTEWSR